MTNKPKPLTPEEIAWTHQQPVVGQPSLTRLRAALEAGGWRPVELVLSDDRECLDFRLESCSLSRRSGREQTLRQLIAIFRGAGFRIGYTELCLADFKDEFVSGMTLVGPLEQICEEGPVPIRP